MTPSKTTPTKQKPASSPMECCDDLLTMLSPPIQKKSSSKRLSKSNRRGSALFLPEPSEMRNRVTSQKIDEYDEDEGDPLGDGNDTEVDEKDTSIDMEDDAMLI